ALLALVCCARFHVDQFPNVAVQVLKLMSILKTVVSWFVTNCSSRRRLPCGPFHRHSRTRVQEIDRSSDFFSLVRCAQACPDGWPAPPLFCRFVHVCAPRARGARRKGRTQVVASKT